MEKPANPPLLLTIRKAHDTEIQLKQTVKRVRKPYWIPWLYPSLTICSSFSFKIKRIPPASAPSMLMRISAACVFITSYRHPFPLCPHFPYSELSQMYLPLKHPKGVFSWELSGLLVSGISGFPSSCFPCHSPAVYLYPGFRRHIVIARTCFFYRNRLRLHPCRNLIYRIYIVYSFQTVFDYAYFP